MNTDPAIKFSVLRTLPPGRPIQILGMKHPETGKHIDALQWEASDGSSAYYDTDTGAKVADEIEPSVI